MNYQQFYIPHGYKELTVPPKDGKKHRNGSFCGYRQRKEYRVESTD